MKTRIRESDLMNFRRQFSWILASRLFGAALQAVLIFLFARWAGPSDFGVAAAVMGAVTFVATASDFGLGTYVVINRAGHPTGPEVYSALRINNYTSIGISVVGLATLVFLGRWSEAIALSAPLAVWMGAERNINVWQSVSLADGTATLNAGTLVGRRTLNVVAFIALEVTLSSSILAYSLSCALSSVVFAIFIQRIIGNRVDRTRRLPAHTVIGESWPYWLTSATSQLKQLDVTLTAVILTSGTAGLYAFVVRLVTPLNLLATSMAPLLSAHVRRDQSKASVMVIKPTLFVLGTMTAVLSFLAAMAPTLLEKAVGPEYLSATTAFRIICVAVFFQSAIALLQAILQGYEMKKSVMKVSAVTSALYLGGVSAGAFLFGLDGAAWGVALASIAQLCMLIATWRFRLTLSLPTAGPLRRDNSLLTKEPSCATKNITRLGE